MGEIFSSVNHAVKIKKIMLNKRILLRKIVKFKPYITVYSRSNEIWVKDLKHWNYKIPRRKHEVKIVWHTYKQWFYIITLTTKTKIGKATTIWKSRWWRNQSI